MSKVMKMLRERGYDTVVTKQVEGIRNMMRAYPDDPRTHLMRIGRLAMLAGGAVMVLEEAPDAVIYVEETVYSQLFTMTRELAYKAHIDGKKRVLRYESLKGEPLPRNAIHVREPIE